MNIDNGNSQLRLSEGKKTHIVGEMYWKCDYSISLCGIKHRFNVKNLFPYAFKLENVTCNRCLKKAEKLGMNEH